MPTRIVWCPRGQCNTNRQNISFAVDLADPAALLTTDIVASAATAFTKIV